MPEAKKRAIGRIISHTTELEFTTGFEAALQYLKENMVGELSDAPDLYGVLGRLFSRQPGDEHRKEARSAFSQSHRLGSSKTDSYYHWMMMEKNIAESMANWPQGSELDNDTVARQWKECERIAEMGIERCGTSQLLCYWAGYAACREAKARERAQSFARAQGAYARSRDRLKQALLAPVSDAAPVRKGAIYRSLTVVLEGLGELGELQQTLLEWGEYSRADEYFVREYRRLAQRHPRLRADPKLEAVFRQHASE